MAPKGSLPAMPRTRSHFFLFQTLSVLWGCSWCWSCLEALRSQCPDQPMSHHDLELRDLRLSVPNHGQGVPWNPSKASRTCKRGTSFTDPSPDFPRNLPTSEEVSQHTSRTYKVKPTSPVSCLATRVTNFGDIVYPCWLLAITQNVLQHLMDTARMSS